MNARTKAELLQSEQRISKPLTAEWLNLKPEASSSRVSDRSARAGSYKKEKRDESPVIRHLDNLQEQLSQQLDSLSAVVESMQHISKIMDQMAKKNCKLNSGAGLVDPARKASS